MFPPQPSCLRPHAPWKNDDLTSLKPCHLSPTDSLKRVLSPSRMGFQRPPGAQKSQTELSERKFLMFMLSKCWLGKRRGWGKLSSEFRQFWGTYSSCDGFKYVQSKGTPCHQACLLLRPFSERPWAWSPWEGSPQEGKRRAVTGVISSKNLPSVLSGISALWNLTLSHLFLSAFPPTQVMDIYWALRRLYGGHSPQCDPLMPPLKVVSLPSF